MDTNLGASPQTQSTFWSEELPASPSASRACDKDSKTHAETSCSLFLQSLNISNPNGFCGKMSPVFCHQTTEKILVPSLGAWGNWGMGSPTEFWTLNGAEHTGTQEPSRNAEGVCSLSDVLEITLVPQRFYLSQKACQGILRRAERRGKALPQMLLKALQQVSRSSDSGGTAETPPRP